MDWPFKHMAVGERIAITDDIARAQHYVHVYAKTASKAFKTKRFTLEDGTEVLGVKRLPDPPGTARAASERREWPFKKLRVGEWVDIREMPYSLVRQRALTYGRNTGKRFEAVEHGTGVRVIRRA